MFGRRATYVMSRFVLGLFIVPIFFDTIYASLVFLLYGFCVYNEANRLELPCTNEIEELDFGRGALAISSAVLVFLILVPMS